VITARGMPLISEAILADVILLVYIGLRCGGNYMTISMGKEARKIIRNESYPQSYLIKYQ